MALLVLITLGATLGWLASILTRVEEPRLIMRQMGVGLAATLVVGLLVNDWTLLGGLSWIALTAGCLAAIAALTIFAFVAKEPSEPSEA